MCDFHVNALLFITLFCILILSQPTKQNTNNILFFFFFLHLSSLPHRGHALLSGHVVLHPRVVRARRLQLRQVTVYELRGLFEVEADDAQRNECVNIARALLKGVEETALGVLVALLQQVRRRHQVEQQNAVAVLVADVVCELEGLAEAVGLRVALVEAQRDARQRGVNTVIVNLVHLGHLTFGEVDAVYTQEVVDGEAAQLQHGCLRHGRGAGQLRYNCVEQREGLGVEPLPREHGHRAHTRADVAGPLTRRDFGCGCVNTLNGVGHPLQVVALRGLQVLHEERGGLRRRRGPLCELLRRDVVLTECKVRAKHNEVALPYLGLVHLAGRAAGALVNDGGVVAEEQGDPEVVEFVSHFF
eukprot:PhM_4_TR10954/c0_g1_i1/m.36425